MFQNRYLFILYFLLGILYSQPKYSIGIDVGYYQPDIPVSSTNQLPASSGFSKDILPGFSLSYNFFPGARIGFAHSFSYQSDKTKSGTPFSRILSYRMFLIETYYFSKERLEWNFSLGPLWNKGSIKIATKVNRSTSILFFVRSNEPTQVPRFFNSNVFGYHLLFYPVVYKKMRLFTNGSFFSHQPCPRRSHQV